MKFLAKTWDDKSGWGKLKRITTQLSPDSNKKKFSQYYGSLGFMRQSVVKDYNWEKKEGSMLCVHFWFYLLFSLDFMCVDCC